MQSGRYLAHSVHVTVALFVISGDLDPILDYGQVKSHYEDLKPQKGMMGSEDFSQSTQSHHISF